MDTFTWKTSPFSWVLAEDLAQGLGLPLLAGIVLARRGFTSVAEARTFLDVESTVPDPFLFSDMGEAVDRIGAAIKHQRRVVVHGDYDVDGISATALLVRGLREYGLDPIPYLPSRFVQGYGLSSAAVNEIAGEGDALLITVDCGVNYPAEVALARDLGLDVIVTDHHRPGDVLPTGPLIHVAVGDYPHGDLCGVGLALKLLHGLWIAQRGGPSDHLPEGLLPYLYLVALGTIADLVPLVGENRYYVREGLLRLGQTRNVGARALMDVAAVHAPVDSHAAGFRLAPRLNAAGRLGDPQAPLRLLLTDDEAEARGLAAELDALNRQRQDVEAGIVVQAVAQVEALEQLPSALVLADASWHEGVIGIVASRIVERYHRPTVLLAIKEGVARGSGRSISGYDLMDGLRACDDLLAQYGGHRMAAGMSLQTEDIAEFTARLQAHAARVLTDTDMRRRYSPDAVVRGDDLTLETAEALEALAPFGMGNPRVQLLALDARLDTPELTRTGEHLRCVVVVDQVRTRGIGFRFADKLPSLERTDYRAHAGLRLQAGEWQGRERCEVQLHSLYATADQGTAALGCSLDCPFLDPLDMPPPCPRCAEPFAEATSEALPPANDQRDRPGRLSALAQILSAGEPSLVVGASTPRVVRQTAGLPLTNLGVAGLHCVSRLCLRTHMAAVGPHELVVLDWAAAERRPDLTVGRRHVIVAEPPYLPSHIAWLGQMAGGARIHLVYGEPERAAVSETLRQILHPRSSMVALFRSRRDGLSGVDVRAEAVRRAWRDHAFVPSAVDLSQAEILLEELGLLTGKTEGVTMKATDSVAYRAAERVYQEAIARCRTM